MDGARRPFRWSPTRDRAGCDGVLRAPLSAAPMALRGEAGRAGTPPRASPAAHRAGR